MSYQLVPKHETQIFLFYLYIRHEAVRFPRETVALLVTVRFLVTHRLVI